MFIRYCLILFLLTLVRNAIAVPPQKEPWILILVHGNMDLKPHIFCWENLSCFMRDELMGSAYLESVTRLRSDSFFYQHHAMQELGLHRVDEHKVVPGYASGAFAVAHRYITKTIAPLKTFHYYTFGWSGIQSPKQRLQDAHLLYDSLVGLLKEYKKRNLEPRVGIVGYSHGANVVLNVGHWYKAEDLVKIDEAILIGVPVIPESDIYITSPIFKKIFNIYSMGDRVQPIDCLSWSRFLSGRLFKARSNLQIPDNVYQIRIGIKRIARNSDISTFKPYQYFPKVRSSLIRRADPGHIELWSFGWANYYRPYFPLYPLPLGVYCSFITHFVQSNPQLGNVITLTLLPYCQKLHAQGLGIYLENPFLVQQQFEFLENLVQPFIPLDYTAELFGQRVQAVLSQVAQERYLKGCKLTSTCSPAAQNSAAVLEA